MSKPTTGHQPGTAVARRQQCGDLSPIVARVLDTDRTPHGRIWHVVRYADGSMSGWIPASQLEQVSA